MIPVVDFMRITYFNPLSAEEKMISSTSATTAITATTVQPTTAATQETTIKTTEPVSTAEAAVSDAGVTSTG